MVATKGNIIVKFHPIGTYGNTGILLAERYMIQEADKDGETDAYGITTDRRLINPQVVTLLSGEYKGRQAFVYYGAYEIATRLSGKDERHILTGESVGEGCMVGIIPEKCVYFLLDPICMLDTFHLGEEVFAEGERTASGIYITPFSEQKQGVLIKLTNVCENSPYRVGDTVVTIDPFQYTLTYPHGGKKYVKLTTNQIIGLQKEGEYAPMGETFLIEYVPDVDQAERTAENDRRAARRDFIDKMGLFYSKEHAEGRDKDLDNVIEPPMVRGVICKIGEFRYGHDLQVGDEVLLLRNYGCVLPNKQWIVNMDTIIGVIDNGNKEISGHA